MTGSSTLAAIVDGIAIYIVSDIAMTCISMTCWQMTRFPKPEINHHLCPLSIICGHLKYLYNLEVCNAKRELCEVELDGPNYDNNAVGRRYWMIPEDSYAWLITGPVR